MPLDANLQIRHRNERHGLNGVPTAKHVFITFENGGATISANSNVSNVVELQNLAFALEEKLVLPQVRARHKAGQPVVFGPITLHGHTLRLGAKSENLANVRLSLLSGTLYASNSREHLGTYKIAKISNFMSLMELLKAAGAKIDTPA